MKKHNSREKISSSPNFSRSQNSPNSADSFDQSSRTGNHSSPSSNARPKSSSVKSSELTGPTVLTIIRMFLAVIFFILVLIQTPPTHILALVAFVAGAISDLIDGKWARKRKKVTDLGAFLDPLADKILTSLAFLALVMLGIIPIWVFAIILVRDYAVDGMRMMAAREGVTIAASKYGKWKTAFQLTALIIFLSNLILNWPFLTICGNIVLYVSLFLSVFSGLDYLLRNWKKVIK